MGTNMYTNLSKFFRKVNDAKNYCQSLFTNESSFSTILYAASVVSRKGVDLERELDAIKSIPHAIFKGDDVMRFECLMALANLSAVLPNFVDSCQMFKFRFTLGSVDSRFS